MTRSWSRPVRSRRRTFRGPRLGLRPMSFSFTAPVTAGRATFPRGGARRRRRQHGLPDREGACGNTQDVALGRLAPDAAPAKASRSRPLLVADEDAAAEHDGGIANRAAPPTSRHADRVQPTGVETELRRRGEAPRRLTQPGETSDSRTAATSRSTPSSGRPDTGRTTPGSIFPCSTRMEASVTGGVSPTCRASTSSA